MCYCNSGGAEIIFNTMMLVMVLKAQFTDSNCVIQHFLRARGPNTLDHVGWGNLKKQTGRRLRLAVAPVVLQEAQSIPVPTAYLKFS